MIIQVGGKHYSVGLYDQVRKSSAQYANKYSTQTKKIDRPLPQGLTSFILTLLSPGRRVPVLATSPRTLSVHSHSNQWGGLLRGLWTQICQAADTGTLTILRHLI